MHHSCLAVWIHIITALTWLCNLFFSCLHYCFKVTACVRVTFPLLRFSMQIGTFWLFAVGAILSERILSPRPFQPENLHSASKGASTCRNVLFGAVCCLLPQMLILSSKWRFYFYCIDFMECCSQKSDYTPVQYWENTSWDSKSLQYINTRE